MCNISSILKSIISAKPAAAKTAPKAKASAKPKPAGSAT